MFRNVKYPTHLAYLTAGVVMDGGVCVDLPGLREILEAVSHKWDLLILACLRERPLRYSELHHRIRDSTSDLTEGVLSKNLRRLHANGLIQQRLLDGNHHVWDLTPRGQQMLVGLAQITNVETGSDMSGLPAATAPTDNGDVQDGRRPGDDAPR
jgi:DNA-binding HxlR family transcriptional regulator